MSSLTRRSFLKAANVLAFVAAWPGSAFSGLLDRIFRPQQARRTPSITPNEEFYVTSYRSPPTIRIGEWALASAADPEALTPCSRLSNDTDLIREFFGDDIFKKLRLYTERLAEAELRRRRPDSILSDDKVRKAFFSEVSDEVRHFLPAPQVKDADAIERELKSYFKAKLASI